MEKYFYLDLIIMTESQLGQLYHILNKKKLYDILRVILEEINNPENQFFLKLDPGMLLMAYNWRVLHARTQYTGTRRICGCYVSVNDFYSTIRKIGYPNLKLPRI